MELDAILESQEKILRKMVGVQPEFEQMFDQIEIREFGSSKVDLMGLIQDSGLLDYLTDPKQAIEDGYIQDVISDEVDAWRDSIPYLKRPSSDYGTEVKEKLSSHIISYKNDFQEYSVRLEKYRQNSASEWKKLEAKAEPLRLEIQDLSMLILAIERT